MAILLIKPKHIGDMILLTPAIRHLRENLPDEPLCLLLRSGTECAVANNPDITSVFAVGQLGNTHEPLGKRLRKSWEMFRWLRHWRFRAAIDFGISDRGAITSLLSGAKRRLAYRPTLPGLHGRTSCYTELVDFRPDPIRGHEIFKDLRLAETFLEKRCEQPKLVYEVPQSDRAWAEAYWSKLEASPSAGTKRILCHMTSRWMFKCWDAQRTATLLDRINQRFSTTILLSAGDNPSELERANQIRSAMTTEAHILNPPVSFELLGAVIQAAQLYIGVDSGPTHLAAAVGTPAVGIYGPTHPVRWGPWGGKSRAIFNGCHCQEAANMTCSKASTMDCLASISPEQVLDAVAELLED